MDSSEVGAATQEGSDQDHERRWWKRHPHLLTLPQMILSTANFPFLIHLREARAALMQYNRNQAGATFLPV